MLEPRFKIKSQYLVIELCDNLDGWDAVGRRFKREEAYVYLWLSHADVRQKPTQRRRATVVVIQLPRHV